jgi:hypothetical protein
VVVSCCRELCAFLSLLLSSPCCFVCALAFVDAWSCVCMCVCVCACARECVCMRVCLVRSCLITHSIDIAGKDIVVDNCWVTSYRRLRCFFSSFLFSLFPSARQRVLVGSLLLCAAWLRGLMVCFSVAVALVSFGATMSSRGLSTAVSCVAAGVDGVFFCRCCSRFSIALLMLMLCHGCAAYEGSGCVNTPNRTVRCVCACVCVFMCVYVCVRVCVCSP